MNLNENDLLLVTGATGLVGSHVAEAARGRGLRTRGSGRESSDVRGRGEGVGWARRGLVGGGEEKLNDTFDRDTPDHAVDAVTNAVAEFDAVQEPWQPPSEPLQVW